MNTDLSAHADALQAVLTDKGLLQAGDLEDFRHKVTEEWLPRNGARLCARAWVDPAFKAELLKDGRAAAARMGLSMPEHHRSLVVLENTAELQNVICCTLCSCTAFTIIGMAPGWYKDLEYRARVVREARSVLRDMGLALDESIHIRVWDTTTDTRCMSAKRVRRIRANAYIDMERYSTLTCPQCGTQKKELMPTDSCQFFYECAGCNAVLRPKAGDCCVYCSYGDIPCPPTQGDKSCCGKAWGAPARRNEKPLSAMTGVFAFQAGIRSLALVPNRQKLRRLQNPVLHSHATNEQFKNDIPARAQQCSMSA